MRYTDVISSSLAQFWTRLRILNNAEVVFVNCKSLSKLTQLFSIQFLYCLPAAKNELYFPTYGGKLRHCIIKLTPVNKEIHANLKYLDLTIL